MFPDNTLTPREAVRLCALGILAERQHRYSALADLIRDFVGHVLGPSLDLMGTSIELLKLEGLVEAVDGLGMEDDAEIAITPDGHQQFRALLTARLRSGATELNKLVCALKFRFLHLLGEDDQRDQVDLLIDFCSGELVRLENLRERHAEDGSFLGEWLDHDLRLLEQRIAWLQQFRARFPAAE